MLKYIIFLVFVLIFSTSVLSGTFIGNDSRFILIIEDGNLNPYIVINSSNPLYIPYIGSDYMAEIGVGGGGNIKEPIPEVVQSITLNQTKRNLIQQTAFGLGNLIKSAKKIYLIMMSFIIIMVLLISIYFVIIKRRRKNIKSKI